MARTYVPRKVKPRRPHRVSVWVTDGEKAMIEEAASIVGETVAEFIRTATLGAASATIVEETERLRGEDVPG